MSHLLQMRGLKPRYSFSDPSFVEVASFTDAWIETPAVAWTKSNSKSHLLQMRGLKLILLKLKDSSISRIFYRCVD